MPVGASLGGILGIDTFSPRGFQETQAMTDWVDTHVPEEVQHFAVTSTINLLARNPYVFIGTVVGHAGYHLYERYNSTGMDPWVSGEVAVTVTGGDSMQTWFDETGTVVGGVSPVFSDKVVTADMRDRGVRGRGFRRCPFLERPSGLRCVLQTGHSGRHRVPNA